MSVQSTIQSAVKPSLTVKRRLKASPAKVFAAWTDPEKIRRWMGPEQFETPQAESDARVGKLIAMVQPPGTRQLEDRVLQRRLARRGIRWVVEFSRHLTSAPQRFTITPLGAAPLLGY